MKIPHAVRSWLLNGLVVGGLVGVLALFLFAPLPAVSLMYALVPYGVVALLFAVGAAVSAGSYRLAPMPVVRNFVWICLYGTIVYLILWLWPLELARQVAMTRFLILLLLANGVYAHFLQRLLYIIEPLCREGVLRPPWWAEGGLWLAGWVNTYAGRDRRGDGQGNGHE
jgi:hypothetical protein